MMCIEKIQIALHKPYMKTRIKKYRLDGVCIGENCRIFTDLSFAEPYLVTIGNNVTISTNCNLITHDNSVIKFINNATDVVGRVSIGNNCFIGANSIILPGVTLADGTIVGAGSVVCKSVSEPNQVIAGNPAKIIASTNKLQEKYENSCFDFRKLNKQERKIQILSNEENLIVR